MTRMQAGLCAVCGSLHDDAQAGEMILGYRQREGKGEARGRGRGSANVRRV